MSTAIETKTNNDTSKQVNAIVDSYRQVKINILKDKKTYETLVSLYSLSNELHVFDTKLKYYYNRTSLQLMTLGLDNKRISSLLGD